MGTSSTLITFQSLGFTVDGFRYCGGDWQLRLGTSFTWHGSIHLRRERQVHCTSHGRIINTLPVKELLLVWFEGNDKDSNVVYGGVFVLICPPVVFCQLPPGTHDKVLSSAGVDVLVMVWL